ISPYGHDIAEALGVPSAEALLQPSVPSRAYPPMIASNLDLGPVLNRGLGSLLGRIPAPVDAAVAHIRSELGLPRESRHAAVRRRMRAGLPAHHGISPVVLPRPKDWPSNLSLDGFWWPVVDEDWAPEPDLAEFLAAGPPPVLITLGSVDVRTGGDSAVADFVRTTDRRVIVQGASGLVLAEAAPHRVFAAGDVPHSWLLPQAAAAVHQAGASITAACLRARTPGLPPAAGGSGCAPGRRRESRGAPACRTPGSADPTAHRPVLLGGPGTRARGRSGSAQRQGEHCRRDRRRGRPGHRRRRVRPPGG